MHEHDLRFVRKVVETIRDRLGARSPPDRDEQTIDVALKEPGRRIAGILLREDAHHRANVVALHERLHAVEEHRLPRDPPKLLELRSADARAAAGGDDHDTDVRHSRGAHAKSR